MKVDDGDRPINQANETGLDSLLLKPPGRYVTTLIPMCITPVYDIIHKRSS